MSLFELEPDDDLTAFDRLDVSGLEAAADLLAVAARWKPDPPDVVLRDPVTQDVQTVPADLENIIMIFKSIGYVEESGDTGTPNK